MNFKRLKLNRNIINQTIVGYLGQEIFPVVSNKTGYDIYRYNIDSQTIKVIVTTPELTPRHLAVNSNILYLCNNPFLIFSLHLFLYIQILFHDICILYQNV